MELPTKFYEEDDYLTTPSGNKVSKSCLIVGPKRIGVKGRTILHDHCVLRADLNFVNIDRLCIFGEGVILRPGYKQFKTELKFLPMHIGTEVVIGDGSIISAANIGHYVWIGKNCVVGRRCVLRDCCKLEDNTVLPPDTNVPPFSVFAGSPGRQVGCLPESWQATQERYVRTYYERFKPMPKLSTSRRP